MTKSESGGFGTRVATGATAQTNTTQSMRSPIFEMDGEQHNQADGWRAIP